MQTSALALDLIRTAEGFEPSAYICPAGQVTIGYGNTCWEDGEPIHLGDEIDQASADQLLWSHVRNEVEPALDRLFHVPLQQNQRDALADFIYNFGEAKTKGYTLTRLINEGAPHTEICDWWVKYRVASGKPLLGLYRRRLAEVMMWNGLPTDKAWTAKETTTWRELCGVPEYEPVESPPTPTEAKVPDKIVIELPANWASMSKDQRDTFWLNCGMAEMLGASVPSIPVEAPKPIVKEPASVTIAKKVIETPKVAADAAPKAMETSETFRGLSKADSGKETAIIGTTVLGGIAYAMPYADQVTSYANKYPPKTIFIVLGVMGLMIAVYGLWRLWRGKVIAYQGRANAEQPKV